MQSSTKFFNTLKKERPYTWEDWEVRLDHMTAIQIKYLYPSLSLPFYFSLHMLFSWNGHEPLFANNFLEGKVVPWTMRLNISKLLRGSKSWGEKCDYSPCPDVGHVLTLVNFFQLDLQLLH